MHLQLFDYLLSKLCNRRWLPKCHSYCCCRTIWHEWLCGRFLRWILVWPCQYHIVVLQLFVDIAVTPMSAAGFQHLRHLAGRQTRSVTALKSRCKEVQLFTSYSPEFPGSNWLLPCTEWQEQLEVLSQRDSAPTPYCERAICWSLTGFMDYILAFGSVSLLLAFWECVINGAQWTVNVRKNVNFGPSQMYVHIAVWDTKQISSHASFCLPCDEKCFVIEFHWY